MKKRLFNLILFMIMFLPILVYADKRVINGNDFDIYKRSKEDIANKWTVGEINKDVTIFSSEPSYVSPYKAGVTTDEYLSELVDNLNYYRYLVGVPEIKEGTTNDESLQTAEVIQTLFVESNHRLTHKLYNDFPKPDDMTDEFYNLGAHANHNIISYGMPHEPVFYFFDESIFNKDDPKNGHRMALLSPEIVKEDFGVGKITIYGRSTQDINNYDNMTNDFAAYPSPGYFPKQDFADISDWDLFLNIDKFNPFTTEELKNIKVTFKNLTTGVSEERTYDAGNLKLEQVCNSRTCLYIRFSILQPTRDTIYYNDEYEVTVENLKDNNSELVDIKYNVKFYDKLEYMKVNAVSTYYDYLLDTVCYDGDFNQNLLDNALEGVGLNIRLEGDYQVNYVPDNFIYQKDNDNSTSLLEIYHALPNYNKLPSYVMDPNNVLDDAYLTIRGFNSSRYYRFNYGDMEYTKEVGDNVQLSINDLNKAYDGEVIYYWVKEKDGKFYELDNDKYVMDGLNLSINNLSLNDSGNYYLTVLLTSDYYYSIYYLSKPIKLNVNGDYLLGDMNENGKIDLSDIIILLKRYLNNDASNEEIKLGDMDDDDKIGLKDIILLLKVYLEG